MVRVLWSVNENETLGSKGGSMQTIKQKQEQDGLTTAVGEVVSFVLR